MANEYVDYNDNGGIWVAELWKLWNAAEEIALASSPCIFSEWN
jgi:hypothetical protein